jgi:hypothetical protein
MDCTDTEKTGAADEAFYEIPTRVRILHAFLSLEALAHDWE